MAMTERKGFTKVPEFDGSASTFEVWSYKMRGFLQSEPGYRGLLEWIERLATMEEDDHGNRPMSLLRAKMTMHEDMDERGIDAWASERIPELKGADPDTRWLTHRVMDRRALGVAGR